MAAANVSVIMNWMQTDNGGATGAIGSWKTLGAVVFPTVG